MRLLSLGPNSQSPRFPIRRALVSGLALLALVLVRPAAAQDAKSVEPYLAVAAPDGAVVRCGESDRFYRVGELTQGQLVTVDGESAAVARIVFPSGIAAYLRADEVKVEGDKATLAQASKFKAFNPVSGTNGSWKSLLAATLPAGTPLKIVESLKDKDGAVVGFKVDPPAGARAFVDLKSLRRATPEEIAAAGGAPSPLVPSNPTTPVLGTNPLKTNPATQYPSQPATTPAPADPNAAQPQDAPVTRKPGTYEALEAAFQSVNKQPVMDAEYDELTAEINKAMNALGDKPADDRIRRQLQARLDVLKIRTDYRDTVRKLKNETTETDANARRVEDKVAEVNKTRLYIVVGRLHGSSVYDGKQLPLMYRLHSVTGTPRTLGYLKPDPRLGMDKMLGQVVGVIGKSIIDPTLKLEIFTAERVDVIDSARQSTPAPVSPTPIPDAPSAAAPGDAG